MPTAQIIGRHEQAVMSVGFNSLGSLIASGSHDGTVRLWSLTEDGSATVLKAHGDAVTSIAFSPDGSVIAAGTTSSNPFVVFWDVQTGREIRQLLGHRGGINSIAFSPDGRYLVSADSFGSLRLWAAQTGESVWSVIVPAGERYGNAGVALRAVAFSPDGNSIACGGSPGNPHLYEAKSGKHLGMLE